MLITLNGNFLYLCEEQHHSVYMNGIIVYNNTDYNAHRTMWVISTKMYIKDIE